MGGVSALLVLLIISALCAPISPITTLSWTSDRHKSLYGDPLTSFRLVDPEDGAVRMLPIEVRFWISARNTEEYEAYYADASFCVELNGLWKKCKAPGGPPIIFQLLPEGNYTAVAYITDKSGKACYHTTEGVTFTVLDSSAFNQRFGELAERSRTEQHFPKDIHLLQWAEQEQQVEIEDKVLFLGCEPNLTEFKNERDRRRVLQAITKERAGYRDLLTEELECTDTYRGLADKTTRPRLYFGEVWAEMFANRQRPIRDTESQYHLPNDQYPMRELIPYVVGPHVVVSMEGVRFISNNYWRLRSMNGLDDVSLGFWLRITQMDAQHAPEFSSGSARSTGTSSATRASATASTPSRGIDTCIRSQT
ncbi:hypothetical protein PI125_g18356 [Phytophthora idaei]|nr:hypothetical protein PI125_g18356 [Phytophthora idaei]